MYHDFGMIYRRNKWLVLSLVNKLTIKFSKLQISEGCIGTTERLGGQMSKINSLLGGLSIGASKGNVWNSIHVTSVQLKELS